MQSQLWIVVALICICLTGTSKAASSKEDDKIVSLPGQPQVTFLQYSGYVTVDEKQQRALFYYFVEAETNPASKPLVLWLNGGPGCSSLGLGAFTEHGPFKPYGGSALIKNEYSWNKEANILYLESPAGVGFSYSANTSFYYTVNDTITAQDNLIFLQKWFDKFSEYKTRDFFITGESYAGHYVPQLANLIVQSRINFKLKGIAIGNPLLEFNTDVNSEGDFYWSHGLISDSTYQLFTSTCNISQLTRESNIDSVSEGCKAVNNRIAAEIPDKIDGYDVISDVCVSTDRPSRPTFPFILSTQSLPETAENIDICVQEKTYKYLNMKDVQEAFHAKLVGNSNWDFCTGVVKYDKQNLEIPTINVVGSLVSSGIRVLIYSGDQDSVIPFIGSRTLLSNLAKQLGLNTTVTYRAWFEDKQVGGWTEVYGDILSFATVRGASHLAPFSSPKRSLALFKAFMAGNRLS